MDGIINLHKPTGITSAKALYRVRSLTGQRKSGHGGTLDPAASGVLLLCLGRATKLVERIMDQPKVYRATARLDVTSESYDSDRPLVPAERGRGPGVGGRGEVPPQDEVLQALLAFEGEIQQVPPSISAVKIAGQPAYKRKAGDAPLDLKPRAVRIYWIHLHSYDWPVVDFEMCCGRGTYVRALIRDLGQRLGTGGCLTSLVRTRIGPFQIEDAWTMEAIADKSQDAPPQSTIDPNAPDSALHSGNRQSTIDNRQSTIAPIPPYLIPFNEAVRLLSSEALQVPPRS